MAHFAGAKLEEHLEGEKADAFIAGFRFVMAMGVGLALLSAACAWFLLPGARRGDNRA
jgi:hypothetical protein